jgi:hypothetical protein
MKRKRKNKARLEVAKMSAFYTHLINNKNGEN